MKTKDWFKNMLDEFQDDSDFRLETLILNLTEKICEIMKQKSVDNAGLSELLNIPKPAVTEMLEGNSDFPLKTLLSVADALNHDLEISFREKKRNVVELRPILDKRVRSDGKQNKQELKNNIAMG
ncbi:XRE family transcriptional regulator [Desulfococcaceae bacterium HSG8]|nr:XRE family transcriptional regulator [Desulfococcaceae bacterium HSG8]